jgi:glutamate/tyrosine decarboxylase-like PLP-dependent enzyme
MADRRLLERTMEIAEGYLASLPERRVAPDVDPAALAASFGGPLPEDGCDPLEAVEALARAAGPGLVQTAGPRYFGFVIGGSLPAATAADLLAVAWDQNAGAHVMSPAAAAAESAAATWVLDLLGLPPGAGVGFTTGAQMANVTCLAAARREVLGRVGWDVDRDGLAGAPPLRVVMGDEAHVTVNAALRLLGLGYEACVRVAADGQGRMDPEALAAALATLDGPAIVCAQAGNVNTGACDPLEAVAEASGAAGAWLHVDGAFGLWAAASPGRRHLTAGLERADSWAVDAHKWLNVPYDSGLAVVADPEAHRASMGFSAAYLPRREGVRDGYDWVADSSRRARGFAVWAALRSLGRAGVADLVERCCRMARRFADGLCAEPGVRILNDVVLNQALVRFAPEGGDGDAVTRGVVARVQRDGTCWLGGTRWRGAEAMRISVSGWATGEEDVDASVDSILRAYRAETVRAA